MTQRQSAICRNRLRCKIERRKADASRRGRLGVEARRLKIQREGPRWEVFRTLEVHDPATNTTNHWTISSTGDPAAPLGVCVNKVWSKLVSERSLRALLARKLWKMAAR